MHGNFSELVHAWHDFYLLIGTAAAALIGLMFVAVSVGANYLTESHTAAVQSFFTPTVVYFASVFVTCVLLLAPLGPTPLGAILLALGLGGLGYASVVWVRMGRRGFTATIDMPDRLWYALSPVAAHALVVVAATVLLVHNQESGLEILGTAIVLQLLVAIRNAWDITAWIVMRSQQNKSSPRA